MWVTISSLELPGCRLHKYSQHHYAQIASRGERSNLLIMVNTKHLISGPLWFPTDHSYSSYISTKFSIIPWRLYSTNTNTETRQEARQGRRNLPLPKDLAHWTGAAARVNRADCQASLHRKRLDDKILYLMLLCGLIHSRKMNARKISLVKNC